jgi:hypothetical protein
MNKSKTPKPGSQQHMVRAYVATDTSPCINGIFATCMFFGRKPKLVRGFWYQSTKTQSGRWPMDDAAMKVKPGQIVAVTICPNSDSTTQKR